MGRDGAGVGERAEKLVGVLQEAESNQHIARVAAAGSRLLREGRFPPNDLANRLFGIMHMLPLGFMFLHDAWVVGLGEAEGSFRRWFDGPAYSWKAAVLTGNEPKRLVAMDLQEAEEK